MRARDAERDLLFADMVETSRFLATRTTAFDFDSKVSNLQSETTGSTLPVSNLKFQISDGFVDILGINGETQVGCAERRRRD
jgi:hypothetical protein